MWYQDTKWLIIIEAAYLLLTLFTCFRIIIDTRSVSKTLAYLLLVIFIPILGIAFYFSFGINYRKRKLYQKKLIFDENFKDVFEGKNESLIEYVKQNHPKELEQQDKIIKLLVNPKVSHSMLYPNNEVQILKNGEEFFPLLLQELKKAKHHIHIEYYIYENDIIGNQIKDILIQKAKEGVEIRFIYDDFGSKNIRKAFVKELREAGIKAFPFNKITFIALANKLNYRNHRKIVVIDKCVSFTGGINISDKYDNTKGFDLYWRDTHLMIKGLASISLQQIFMTDWNFCSNENLHISSSYFPSDPVHTNGKTYMQVVSSGPDYDKPNILYSIIKAITSAEKEILLTTPYYIPDSSLQDALILAALSGVQVKLLVPKDGDSSIVNMAAQSYYSDLLYAGVRIFKYKKGFVHAKTFVTDRSLASIGTANLDVRSFDLNFEVNTLIYDKKVAEQLAKDFDLDIENSEEITFEDWDKRGKVRKVTERILRLLSPFM